VFLHFLHFLDSIPTMTFPTNFLWGAASAAYQIEGAANEDGRGESVWDIFCKQPGNIYHGHTGDTACDHYHRYKGDVGLMKDMGLKAYRLSTSWPRIIPDGVGKVNAKGLDFYDRLIDEVLRVGIEPWVTLFHWDFPQTLFNAGGWLNRDSSHWFADYTKAVVEKLSDRVSHWITLNEPQIYIGLGHFDVKHAPGIKYPFSQALLAGHHTLMAHGRAVQVIRAHAKKKPIVGWAPIGKGESPFTESAADIAAAREASMSSSDRNFFNNTWFGDAVVFGKYPAETVKLLGAEAPVPQSGDMDLIAQKIDFYGLNIYSGGQVKAGADGKAVPVWLPPGHARNALSWSVFAPSLRWGPRFVYERYKLPIVITENGMSNLDWVHSDGAVHDPQRIDYTRRYLIELNKAIEDGADIQGYFHWSILDNFEWGEGYKDRFGMIFVDYETQQRTLKDSAHWYAEVIATNGKILESPHAGLEPKMFAYV